MFAVFTKTFLRLHVWNDTSFTAATKYANQVKFYKMHFLVILTKVFLSNSLENWNLQSHNPYVINLKGHLFNNVEGYLYRNSLFVHGERQYHIKIYNIVSSVLVWVAPKILRINVVNVLVFGRHWPPKISTIDWYCSNHLFYIK